jgi:antitoxin VapB
MEAVMGMNIKNERVERLARELATETGQTITGAIEQALEGELRRLRRNDELATRKARIKEILRRSGPTPPGVTSDHSDLYDEWGLPK